MPSKSKRHIARRGRLQREGASAKDAKANLDAVIDAIVSDQVVPTLVTVHGQHAIVFRDLDEWAYTTLRADGSSTFTAFGTGVSREKVEAAARTDLAQRAWSDVPSTACMTPDQRRAFVLQFVRDAGLHNGLTYTSAGVELAAWIHWQIRYSMARALGYDDTAARQLAEQRTELVDMLVAAP